MTGSAPQTSPSVIEAGEAEARTQGFRARLGAKFKSMLEWMRERLFFSLRR
jgi:hypothetical protein